MDSCKYHPLTPATFICHKCKINACDACVDTGNAYSDPKCFICGKEMESLGAVNYAVPFWRRLEETFRYPFNIQTGSLIIITGILTGIISFLPGIIALIVSFIISAALVKYSFDCLERTSRGDFTPPQLLDSLEGGRLLLLQLVVLIIIVTAAAVFAISFLGSFIGGIIAFLLFVSLPAMTISLAIEENLLEALNPVKTYSMITAIGLPYGLLLGFLMIMMGSLEVISQLFSMVEPVSARILQSCAANYYWVVAFHMMGYMIFENQKHLGFSARESDNQANANRGEHENIAANISIYIKEGMLDQAFKKFEELINKFPNNQSYQDDFFELLVKSGNKKTLTRYSTFYLRAIANGPMPEKLGIAYKRIAQVIPNYLPNSPSLRVTLAKVFFQRGEDKIAIAQLNGLHKDFPDYEYLADAYQLLADILAKQPRMQDKAKQCQQFATKLRRKKEQEEEARKRQKTVKTKKVIDSSFENLRNSLTNDSKKESSLSGFGLVPKDE